MNFVGLGFRMLSSDIAVQSDLPTVHSDYIHRRQVRVVSSLGLEQALDATYNLVVKRPNV